MLSKATGTTFYIFPMGDYSPFVNVSCPYGQNYKKPETGIFA